MPAVYEISKRPVFIHYCKIDGACIVLLAGKSSQTQLHTHVCTTFRFLNQVSEIDLKVGLLPGLPMSLRGTVVTKARLNPVR